MRLNGLAFITTKLLATKHTNSHITNYSHTHYAYVGNELCHVLLILSRSDSSFTSELKTLNQSQYRLTHRYRSPYEILIKINAFTPIFYFFYRKCSLIYNCFRASSIDMTHSLKQTVSVWNMLKPAILRMLSYFMSNYAHLLYFIFKNTPTLWFTHNNQHLCVM